MQFGGVPTWPCGHSITCSSSIIALPPPPPPQPEANAAMHTTSTARLKFLSISIICPLGLRPLPGVGRGRAVETNFQIIACIAAPARAQRAEAKGVVLC